MPNCGQARTPVTPSIYLARDQTPFILANFFPLCSSSCTLASHTSSKSSTCRLILKIETLSRIFSQTNSRPGAAVPHASIFWFRSAATSARSLISPETTRSEERRVGKECRTRGEGDGSREKEDKNV